MLVGVVIAYDDFSSQNVASLYLYLARRSKLLDLPTNSRNLRQRPILLASGGE